MVYAGSPITGRLFDSFGSKVGESSFHLVTAWLTTALDFDPYGRPSGGAVSNVHVFLPTEPSISVFPRTRGAFRDRKCHDVDLFSVHIAFPMLDQVWPDSPPVSPS